MSYKAAVITVSDRCSRGEATDTSGPAVTEMLKNAGFEIIYTGLVPDSLQKIRSELEKCSDDLDADIVITTGGTGLSPRDVTPEATKAVIVREVPGIVDAMLFASLKITSRAMLSRAVAGTRGSTLIINLPGSEKAARENLGAIIDTLGHAMSMIGGNGH
jgi:molybdenum cofactor synthesis domain-containing protein